MNQRDSVSSQSPAEPRSSGGADRERQPGAPDQGIVRDQRGQEQPADKERAQRATKTDQVPPEGRKE